MTNIYKGQQAEGELRLEAATSTSLHHSDSFVMYIIRFVKKNIPFLDENIPYLEGGRGGGRVRANS